MKVYTLPEIQDLEKRYRVNLITNISGIRSANLIGTKNKLGISNVSVFNTVTTIGSNPPLIGFIMRPTHVERHTYENIVETKKFTINQINSHNYKKAHLTSAKYPKPVSEFDVCDLQEEYYGDFEAPFVKDSLIKIGLSLKEELHIQSNNTKLIIGSVELIICEDDLVKEDGYINHEQIDTMAIGGLDTYYKCKHAGRFGYAKPGNDLQTL
jgi:flavin reductase (DIM6/NTAB) family NADH-FMN oxidoreductase RutF